MLDAERIGFLQHHWIGHQYVEVGGAAPVVHGQRYRGAANQVDARRYAPGTEPRVEQAEQLFGAAPVEDEGPGRAYAVTRSRSLM